MRRWAVMAAILAAYTALGAPVPKQTVQLVLHPQNQVAPACPMKSAYDGSPLTAYSTADAENNVFTFADFLPSPTAVLTEVSVALSTLGQCSTPNTLAVYINKEFPGVHPYYTTVGTDYASSMSTSGCGDSQQFARTARITGPLITPSITPYNRGGTNVINVIEQPTGTCSVFIEDVTVTLHYYDNLPVIAFELSAATAEDERKVLMNRWRTETLYAYPSSAQQDAATIDHDPISSVVQRDHHIRIKGTITNQSGTPLPNADFYIRVVDPPDPSTYVPAAEVHRGDNLRATSIIAGSHPTWGWASMTADAEGRFSAVLPTTSSAAGDNVQLEASAAWLPYLASEARCTPALGCYTSGVLTAWRRLYVERDRMLRKGSFLTQDALPGVNTLSVVSTADFSGASASAPIAAILIHGDGPEVSTPNNYYETVYVVRAQNNGRLTLQSPITRSYNAVISATEPTKRAGDAIGRYATTADVWPAYLDPSVRFFGATNCATPPACDSLYVDMKVLEEGPGKPNKAPYLPFVSTCSAMRYCVEVAQRFFDARLGQSTLPGHVHFAAATTLEPNANTFTTNTVAMTIGDNDQNQKERSDGRAGGIFVWNRSVDLAIAGGSTLYAGLSSSRVIEEVSAHELVHIFDVNPPAFGAIGIATSGHCTDDPGAPAGGPVASNGTGHCIMSLNRTNAERGDGLFGLHIFPWTTSELRRVRARPDPIPRTWQATATPVP
jgi:hypothetical protein